MEKCSYSFIVDVNVKYIIVYNFHVNITSVGANNIYVVVALGN